MSPIPSLPFGEPARSPVPAREVVTVSELTEPKKLAAIQSSQPETAEVLGMSLAAITDELREKYDLSEDVEGVVVTAVDVDSSAAEQRIQPGDVVTEVSQDEVQTPRELVAKVREVEESNRKSVVLTLTHGGELRFVALRLDRHRRPRASGRS